MFETREKPGSGAQSTDVLRVGGFRVMASQILLGTSWVPETLALTEPCVGSLYDLKPFPPSLLTLTSARSHDVCSHAAQPDHTLSSGLGPLSYGMRTRTPAEPVDSSHVSRSPGEHSKTFLLKLGIVTI